MRGAYGGDLEPEFDWDPEKARINKAKHGVSFKAAKLVFFDPDLYTRRDHESVEERWRTVGLVGTTTLLLVVHADRFVDTSGTTVEVIRIISARRVTRSERLEYERERGWRS